MDYSFYNMVIGKYVVPMAIISALLIVTVLLLYLHKQCFVTVSNYLDGNLMIFLCACSTAVYMVWIKKLILKDRITTVLRWVYCLAAAMALPFGAREIVHADFVAMDTKIALAALFVLVVPTYLPNLMLNYALKFVPATVTSIYTYLQPVLAIALSVAMGLDRLPLDIVIFAAVVP